MKILSEEAIRNIIEKAEEEYEDIEMTDAEWEEKRWSIIAQAQLEDTLRQVVEWGEEDCPHKKEGWHTPRWRSECLKCWQELKQEGSK